MLILYIIIIMKWSVRKEPKNIYVTGSQFGFVRVWSMNNEIIVILMHVKTSNTSM